MSHGPESRPQATEDDGLGRLIETEARIADLLAAARVEADALLRSAGEEAEAEERRFDAELAHDVAALAANITARRDDEIARLARAAEARSRRLREVPDAVVDELAEWVVRQLGLTSGRPA